MYEPSETSYPKLAVQFLDLLCDICYTRPGFRQCKYCSKILCKIHSTGEENCFVQLLNQRAEQTRRNTRAEQARQYKQKNKTNQKATANHVSFSNWIKQQSNSKPNEM